MHTNTLNVVNSNDLQVLSQICASLISSNPLPDPFTPETILVMNSGMKTYLSQELACFSQIQANCRYVHVWQIIWEIYKSINSISETRNPFSKEYLTLNILSLRSIWEDKEGSEYFYFKKLSSYTEHDTGGDRAYELSCRIADIFDQYQMYRADYILAWDEFSDSDFDDYRQNSNERNKIRLWIENTAKFTKGGRVRKTNIYERIKTGLEENIWQIRLWCMLRRNIDIKAVGAINIDYEQACNSIMADRAQMLNALKKTLENDKDAALRVPPRIFVFGVSSLPSGVMDVLQTLSKISSVFIMLLNPCAYYWGDIRDSYIEQFAKFKELLKKRFDVKNSIELPKARKSYIPCIHEYSESEYIDGIRQEGNSLLLSLGKQGRDNLSLLMEYDERVNFINAFSDIEGDTLLCEIKRRLLELDEADLKNRYLIKGDDRSFEIRACHTRMREVEVLKDRILELFNSYSLRGKRLRPRDIVVMVPAINEYAPYIQSVFAPDSDDDMVLPYAISDRSAGQENTVADAIISLLSVDKNRITSNFVLDLLTIPAIASKFNITTDNLELISRWLAENNVLWGIDDDAFEFDSAGHCCAELEKALPFTFSHGLKRMIEGTLLGFSDRDDIYLDIEGSDLKTLSSLYCFIYKIANLKQIFIPSLALEIRDESGSKSWQSTVNELIADFFDTKNEECLEVVSIISNALDTIDEIISDLKLKPQITLATFRAMLESEFSKSNEFSPFLRDKINFCSLVPMRAVPFEHVFILGLNDGEFPRQNVSFNFNLMSFPDLVRRGDRSSSAEDRFLFLEAIISAKQSLYLSYIGKDAVDNSDRNPSIVLSELIDYICDNCTVDTCAADDVDESAVLNRIIFKERLHGYDIENYHKKDGSSHCLYSPSYNKDYYYQCQITGESLENMPSLGLDVFIKNVPENISIDVDELLSFIRDPGRYFLRHVLDIYLTDVDSMSLDDYEHFELSTFDINSLLSSFVGEVLSDRMLFNALLGNDDKAQSQGDSASVSLFIDACLDSYIQDKETDGSIPYGIFAQRAKEQLKDKFHMIAASVQKLGAQHLRFSGSEETKILNFTVDTVRAESIRLKAQNDTECGINICGVKDSGNLRVFCFHEFNQKKIPYKVAFECALVSALNRIIGNTSEVYAIDSLGNILVFKGFESAEALKFLDTVLEFYVLGLTRPLPWCDRLMSKIEFEKLESFNDFILLKQSEGFGGNISFDYLFSDPEAFFENSEVLSILNHFYDFYVKEIIERFGAQQEE